MNLLNVAIVPTHGTFKFFSTNLAYRVFSTSTTRQAYRNRYNVNDHGHKKETIDLDDISRVSNIAFLLDWAQMSDLDFGLIQQNISNKKASFQYQGCPLSFKSGKLWLNSYIFKIRIPSN